MKFQLNKKQAEEVSHKMSILSWERELQDEYGITQDETDALWHSVPNNSGEWEVPDGNVLNAVTGEMENHILILRDQASDMEDDGRGQLGTPNGKELLRQAKETRRLATSLEKLFGLDKVESTITNLTSGNQAKVEQACSIKRLTNIHDAPHDQFLEALLNELTGSGGAGSYEMPLGATPYWKTKKRKKKVTQQNIVTMK